MQRLASKLNPCSLLQKNIYNMYLHEYQAYDLLKKYQVPLVPVTIHSGRASGRALPRTRLRLPKES